MKQPPGFENPNAPNYICRLDKAILVLVLNFRILVFAHLRLILLCFSMTSLVSSFLS
jgi:hypothetical protein